MDDVYTEYQINSHTTFSFSGEVCADSDYRRNRSLRSLTCTLYSVFLGFIVFDPQPNHINIQQPRAHEALEVDGYELPAEICLIQLSMMLF
jgi:hypothetical protein